MQRHDFTLRYPKSYHPIKRFKTVRAKEPLVEAASIRVKARLDVSSKHPERFDSINTIDVFEARLNIRGKRMIVGSTNCLGIPFSSPVNVLYHPDEIRFVTREILRSFEKKQKDSDLTPEQKRRIRQEAKKKLLKIKRKLGISDETRDFPVPDIMLLFESCMVSRIDSIIDFNFDGGLSYKVTRLGTNTPHLVNDPDGSFLNFADAAFVKIGVSNQQYGARAVMVSRSSLYFAIPGSS